jgi:purine catabolism regulator
VADIVLDDLLHWRRDLTYRAPAGEAPHAGLNNVVSWAVTIRATAPVLPTLRGGEIVVLPPRVLDQLERTESFDRNELLRTLLTQPIAALMVDPVFGERPVATVPLLVTSAVFPSDAEPVINRQVTERRTELYRLGSDLSRALSTSNITGAGLDALLDAAAMVARRRLLLLDGEGTLLASSSLAPDDLPIELEEAQRLVQTLPVGKPQRIGSSETWLGQALLDQDRGARRGALLLIECLPDSSTEVERLVVSQTAGAVELVLGHARLSGRATSERANREALVADLLLGRLVSREAAEARARLLSIEPARDVRVALFASTHPDLATRMRAVFPLDRRTAVAALGDHEFAAIVPDDERFETAWRELSGLARSARSADDALVVVASDAVPGPAYASAALAQARALAGLSRAGAIDGWMLDARDHERVGAYGLLYALWSGQDQERDGGARRLTAFADAQLAALEAHDARRGGELVTTLAEFLRRGGALTDTAESLGVHRNTLAYRLSRINQITGRDLADARTRFLLQVALAIRDLERAVNCD